MTTCGRAHSARARAHTHADTHTHTHARKHTRTPTHTHTHSHSITRTHPRALAHTHTHTQTPTHKRTYPDGIRLEYFMTVLNVSIACPFRKSRSCVCFIFLRVVIFLGVSIFLGVLCLSQCIVFFLVYRLSFAERTEGCTEMCRCVCIYIHMYACI